MSGGIYKDILTHSQRVCRLYKKALRTTESWAPDRAVYRFNATVLRGRFDESRKTKDMRELAQMLEDGEHELWANQHLDPKIFKNDPNGICYRREAIAPDWMLDHWHPWEKVQFKDYFDKRDELKKAYEEHYEKSLVKKYQPEPTVV